MLQNYGVECSKPDGIHVSKFHNYEYSVVTPC